jgi:hypothetical protein
MEAIVQCELARVEQLALAAARADERHRQDAVVAAATHAAVALSTLLHVGAITGAEETAWRERIGHALGDGRRLARRGYRITIEDEGAGRERSDAEIAQAAYVTCRDLSLTDLAWAYHTAATESAVAEALAASAGDPARVRRACEHGFADRGKDEVPEREL